MAEPLWTSDEIAKAATGGRSPAAFVATGVSIDSRSIEAGDLFVALAGERDGHDYRRRRLRGWAPPARWISPAEARPSVEVADTFKALEALGQTARDRARGRAARPRSPARSARPA